MTPTPGIIPSAVPETTWLQRVPPLCCLLDVDALSMRHSIALRSVVRHGARGTLVIVMESLMAGNHLKGGHGVRGKLNERLDVHIAGFLTVHRARAEISLLIDCAKITLGWSIRSALWHFAV